MKTLFKNYLINRKKMDSIMEFLSSDDKEVVMVGAGMMKQMFGITENIFRNTVDSIRIKDKISFTNNLSKKKNLEYAVVFSIGKDNIVVELHDKSTMSLIKNNLRKDPHFSILTQ